MERDKNELILRGDMYKAIISISLPLVINNFIHTLYNLADAMWVSRLGHIEFAATSFVFPVTMFFDALGRGISIAGSSILSQLVGASDYKDANKYASQLMAISLIISISIALAGYITSPYIISWMGGTGKLALYSNTYLRICFLGFPFIFISYAFSSILNSQGNTVTTTKLSAISAIVNVVLDPFFIFALNLGVAGAAIATVLSQSILVLGGIYAINKYSNSIKLDFKGFGFDKHKLRKIWNIALPASIGQSGASLGFMVLNGFIASYGTATLAGFGMGNRITDLIMQPNMGIGMGLTTIVGQNMGADQVDRVYEAFRKATRLAIVIGVMGLIILLFWNQPLAALFLGGEDDVEVLREGITYLKFISFSMPFMGIYNVFHGLFQGSGHTKYSMSMGIGRLWAIRLPMISIFKNFTNLGSIGIWLSMSLSNFLICLYGYMIYKSKKWVEKVIGSDIKDRPLA
ncbi:MAG: MATE family efflux transporter [Tissierellia bacterium]|nr:MATE family efflux transporter [Tissierellia bacterium]